MSTRIESSEVDQSSESPRVSESPKNPLYERMDTHRHALQQYVRASMDTFFMAFLITVVMIAGVTLFLVRTIHRLHLRVEMLADAGASLKRPSGRNRFAHYSKRPFFPFRSQSLRHIDKGYQSSPDFI